MRGKGDEVEGWRGGILGGKILGGGKIWVEWLLVVGRGEWIGKSKEGEYVED